MADKLRENIHFPTEFKEIKEPETAEGFVRNLINALMDQWREVRYKVDPIIEASEEIGNLSTLIATMNNEITALNALAHDHNGDFELPANNALYFGDKTTEGSWRFLRSGNNFYLERLVGNNWTEKDHWNA